MSRSERLLSLLQVLRRHRRPVSGRTLADEVGISIRTLYRDIAALRAQGADIEGEPGVGYVLRPGYMLPPLMFSRAEIEALVLGGRWVAKLADAPLTAAADDALAKITAVLPAELRNDLDSTMLFVGPRSIGDSERIDLEAVRKVIRAERKLRITYVDGAGAQTERTIWPFALGYFEQMRILVGWCETRKDFRHFRTDRILAMSELKERYPRRGATLLRDWRKTQLDGSAA
jgi:predicted DNA-binding transcriptional regulator YafY